MSFSIPGPVEGFQPAALFSVRRCDGYSFSVFAVCQLSKAYYICFYRVRQFHFRTFLQKKEVTALADYLAVTSYKVI